MVTLSQVIARVESRGNLGAIRFEPATYAKISNPAYDRAHAACKIANGCSDGTADMILSASWGEYQIMGFNLYPYYEGPIPAFLKTPDDQADCLDKFLHNIGFSSESDAAFLLTDPLPFATKYNGPGNPSVYAALLVSAYKALLAS